jgi:hypothetical protein
MAIIRSLNGSGTTAAMESVEVVFDTRTAKTKSKQIVQPVTTRPHDQ